MGNTAKAHLLYGYKLGGDEPGWDVAGLAEGHVWLPSWAKRADDSTWYDPVTDINNRLTDQLGASDVMAMSTGFEDMFEVYWLVAVELKASNQGEEIQLPMLSIQHVHNRLDRALDVLGIALNSKRPGWHLVASYG